MPRLLLIAEDPQLRTSLTQALVEAGHAVAAAPFTPSVIATLSDVPPDLVIVDLEIPGVDRLEAIRAIREESDVPLITLAAVDGEHDTVRVLDAGADDHLTKPVGAFHLEARIRAILRRTRPTPTNPVVVVGGLRLDRAGRVAELDGRRLDLSPKEFDLLTYLAEHVGTVVSKAVLLSKVWKERRGVSERTVDVHLAWLRRKIGETAARPRYLHTVRGVGVKLVDPTVDRAAADAV